MNRQPGIRILIERNHVDNELDDPEPLGRQLCTTSDAATLCLAEWFSKIRARGLGAAGNYVVVRLVEVDEQPPRSNEDMLSELVAAGSG